MPPSRNILCSGRLGVGTNHKGISMQIVMIGAGYVGLTTGTCLADAGHRVCCYDIDADRMARLSKCDIPIYQPGLEEAVSRTLHAGQLQFASSLDDCLADADIIFIAVGTPSRSDGDIDLSQVQAAARQIAAKLKPGALVVVKSTVTAGTCRQLKKLIATVRRSSDISVASNPEFLREGAAIDDFMNPDRVVIGADEPRAGAMLKTLFEPFINRGVPVVCTSTVNAELIKYAANAFLALKVGFINDVADLCEQAGGDIGPVAQGVGLDKRIGSSFLSPGPGFGGSCFPKDTRAFVATGRRLGAPQRLIETLVKRNEERKILLARRVIGEAGLRRGNTAVFLGLSFKAETDDVRDSAALTMIPVLQRAGISVKAHDPRAMNNARSLLDDVEYADCPYEAARGAAAVILLTEWEQYKSLDLAKLAKCMSGITLFDYRNVLMPEAAAQHGFRYVSLGRASLPPVPKATAGGTSASLWDEGMAANRNV